MNCLVSAISGSMISRLPPVPQRLRYRFEVDLGLAGARHAVEQRHGEILAVDRRHQPMHGFRLLRREIGDAVFRIGLRIAPLRDRHVDQVAGRRPRPSTTPVLQSASVAETPTWRGSARRARDPAPAVAPASCAEARPHPARSARRSWLQRLEGRLRAHHHARHHAERRQRIAGDPFGKPEGRRTEAAARRAAPSRPSSSWDRPACRALRAAHPSTTPIRVCAPNGTSTKAPGSISRPGRHEVVVGLIERRARHQHRREGPRGAFTLFIKSKKTIQVGRYRIRSYLSLFSDSLGWRDRAS